MLEHGLALGGHRVGLGATVLNHEGPFDSQTVLSSDEQSVL